VSGATSCQADEFAKCCGRHLVTPEEFEGEWPAGVERSSDDPRWKCAGRGRKRDDFIPRDRGVQRRPRRAGHQLRDYTQLVEQLRDRPVKRGTVTMPRNSDLLTV
jgi:hypothetical protein